jgi:hypothetical protein
MILEMTASMLMATGIMPSRGTSETADYVASKLRDGRTQLQSSYALGLRGKGVFDELCAIADDTAQPNWDGYGAEVIDEDAYRFAYRFLEALPLGSPKPAVGAEPDGHITLEWYQSPRQTLSVSLSPDGELHYAALLPGPRTANGTEQFIGNVPSIILHLIHETMPG